jgi:hypothetical protein
VHRCGVARLAHPGVQPDVGDEPIGALEARESPTAATVEIPTMASTPGIVINCATTGSSSASTASALSTAASFAAVEVQLAQQRWHAGQLISG